MKREDIFQQRFVQDSSFVARNIGGEYLLVPIRQPAGEEPSIFALNEVSGFIWETIDGKRPVHQIRDAVVQEFDVSPEQAEADLLDFLQQLAEVGAIHAAPEERSSG
jgi:hypothetical protein